MPRLALPFLTFSAFLLLAAPTQAFRFWGAPYQDAQIPVAVSADPEMAPQCPTNYKPYKRAGATWNNAACSDFSFRPRSLTDLDAGGCDGLDHLEFGTLDDNVLAITILIDGCTPFGRETGMVINDVIPWNCEGPTAPGEYDLETVVLHELGHMLGLDHSPERGSIMNSSYHGQQRTLGIDDVNGICALYPVDPAAGTRTFSDLLHMDPQNSDSLDPAVEVERER